MGTAAHRPDEATLRHVVELAVRAPSIHNTQPWRWQLGPDRVELFADRSRQLAVVDRGGRALLVSCGAALLQARIALSAAGWAESTTLLPDPADPDHLATVVALEQQEPSGETKRLVGAARERHTDRRPFADKPVDHATMSMLAVAAAQEGCMLQHVTGHDDRVELIVAIGHADEIESADPDYVAELSRWSERPAGSEEGVPAAATPAPGDRIPDVQPRFRSAPAPATTPSQIERSALLVLATDGDDDTERLRAGQALARVLLTATSTGLAVSPYTQPMEVPATRSLLRRVLGGLGHPQIVLRVGWPEETDEAPPTPRRAIDEVLITDS